MFAIECPHCRQALRLNRPVKNARLKCLKCGNIFVGSTEEVMEGRPVAPSHRQQAPAAGAAAPQGQPGPHPPGAYPPGAYPPGPYGPPGAYGPPPEMFYRRPSRVWPLVVIIIGLPLIGGMIYAGHYLYSNPYLMRKQVDTGEQTFGARVPMQEARNSLDEARRQQEEDAAGKKDKPPAASEPSGQSTPIEMPTATVTDIPGWDTARAWEGQPPAEGGQASQGPSRERIRPGERYQSGAIAQPLTKGDNKIQVTDLKLLPGEVPDSGVLTGMVRNDHDVPVENVRVILQGLPTPVTVYCIPPGRSVRFSIDYSEMTVTDVPSARVYPKLGDAGAVCVQIDVGKCVVEKAGELIVVRGDVRNPTDSELAEVLIWCDFYSPEGIHAGFAKGGLDGADRLGPGKSAQFTVEYDPSKSEMVPDLILQGRPNVRMWARKPS